jgi:hypothetical protein
MRHLHFVINDGSYDEDELFIQSDQVYKVEVESATVAKAYFRNSTAPNESVSDDFVTITATDAKAVALRLSQLMVGTNVGGSSVLTVEAATPKFAEISLIAYTLGS